MQNEFLNKIAAKIEKNHQINKELYTKFDVKRGLRNPDGSGVTAGLTKISSVIGLKKENGESIPVEGQLNYRGINVREIVEGIGAEQRHGFEEVVYLLLFGELPGKEELLEFRRYLASNMVLPNEFLEKAIIPFASRNLMNMLQRSVLALYSTEPDPDNISLSSTIRHCISLIARFPVIIAYAYQVLRYMHSKESLFIRKPNPELDIAENFLYMLRFDGKFSPLEAELLDLALILHAEHGGGNNSAFTVHVLTSTHTDAFSAISGAIGSLKGPLHGAANAFVMNMMADIKKNVKNWSDENEVSAYIEKILEKKAYNKLGLVYGMGHAVYTKSDPRAIILKQKARQLAEEKNRREEFRLYEIIETRTPELFQQVKKSDKIISANVDFYSGFVYDMLGFPVEIYPSIFAMARIAGWAAHRIEEIVNGGRIIRPGYKNVAEASSYVPLDQRR